MRFLAPERLALLILVLLLAGLYVVLQHRRRHYAARFTNVDLLASVAPRRPGWRRHVSAAAMALALAATVVSLARPVRDERVPREQATIMLAVDTSASMEATDVAPTRMDAARSAAAEFVDALPARLRIGLVAFDRNTRVLATPTTDRGAVLGALDRLTTGPGTATGEGLLAAIDALAGAEEASAIVLLSDGVRTVGRPVEQAAAAAAERNIPVTTIAFGTDDGTLDVEGRRLPVPSDPETMAAVADSTGGLFFEAFSAEDLGQVYEDVGTVVGYEVEEREMSAAFATAGLVVLVAAIAAGLAWTGRIL